MLLDEIDLLFENLQYNPSFDIYSIQFIYIKHLVDILFFENLHYHRVYIFYILYKYREMSRIMMIG